MITREQIPSVLEHAVYDPEGNKIGDAKHIFLDDVSGRPEWASVKTGMFGTRESFIPIRDATLVEDRLEVPFEKAKVKDAPAVDVDSGGHLSASEEHRLYEYYGIDWDSAWQQADQPGQSGTAGAAGGAAGLAGTSDTAGTAGDTGAAEPSSSTGMTAGTTGESGMMASGTAGMGTEEAQARQSGDDAMTRSEERIRIGAERRESGHARLHKYVVTEETEQTVPLRHEEVRVEREPITEANRDQALSGPAFTEADHEVTLHAERPVIETEAVPVERVRLNVEERVEQETVHGEIRKERIDVEMPDETTEGSAERGGNRGKDRGRSRGTNR